MSDQPIGIFDSGVGGLSVLQAVRAQLPAEHLIYFADNANLPYGDKPADVILELTSRSVARLVEQRCKLIVIACNTASTTSITELRDRFSDTPIVRVVPMVKPAAESTINGKLAVLATPTTLGSRIYQDLKSQFAAGLEVLDVPCPDWVAMVETGRVDLAALRTVIGFVQQRGTDMIVLGCTHFPFFARQLGPLLAEDAKLLHSGPAIARQVLRVLAANGTLRPAGRGRLRIIATKHPTAFRRRASTLARQQFDRDLRSVMIDASPRRGAHPDPAA